jgi:hypothetical protein
MRAHEYFPTEWLYASAPARDRCFAWMTPAASGPPAPSLLPLVLLATAADVAVAMALPRLVDYFRRLPVLVPGTLAALRAAYPPSAPLCGAPPLTDDQVDQYLDDYPQYAAQQKPSLMQRIRARVRPGPPAPAAPLPRPPSLRRPPQQPLDVDTPSPALAPLLVRAALLNPVSVLAAAGGALALLPWACLLWAAVLYSERPQDDADAGPAAGLCAWAWASATLRGAALAALAVCLCPPLLALLPALAAVRVAVLRRQRVADVAQLADTLDRYRERVRSQSKRDPPPAHPPLALAPACDDPARLAVAGAVAAAAPVGMLLLLAAAAHRLDAGALWASLACFWTHPALLPAPNMAWYFFSLLFPQFRGFFALVLLALPLLVAALLLLRFPAHPLFCLAATAATTLLFRFSPHAAELVVAALLLAVCAPLVRHRLRSPLAIALVAAQTAVGAAAAWHLWAHTTAGNPNYLFFQTAGLSGALALGLVEAVAAVRRLQSVAPGVMTLVGDPDGEW